LFESGALSLFGPEETEIRVVGIAPTDITKTVQEMGVEQLSALHGVGNINASSLYEWFSNANNAEIMQKLEAAGVVALQTAGSTAPQIFAGKIFVLTGTLPTLSREQARAMIKERGGKVSSAVSKKTDYVLAGEEAGSKLEDATKLGVTIINEESFKKLLEEKN
jgi:DNA ligase (NAD+)